MAYSITHKITENGTTVGYMIVDEYNNYPTPKNALYAEFWLLPLLEAGIKYYSREADDITLPDGTPITSLPAVELSTVDLDAWNSGMTLALSSALSDTEASKYYTYKEASAVQFRTESSYEINTREEFIQYLETIKTSLYSVGYAMDNRPLNFFVNPSAMFTVDELKESSELRAYFDVIVKRHIFRNYKSYVSLVDWLCKQGVLNTTNPTSAEFLSAYYAWGPEGIKDPVVSRELKLNVDGKFIFANDSLSSSDKSAYVASNRDPQFAVFDDMQNVYSIKEKECFRDVQTYLDLGRKHIAISDDSILMKMRRSTPTGYKYRVMPQLALSECSTFVSDVTDRLYFNIMSESGYSYQYKVAHNRLRLGLLHANNTIVTYSSNFGFQTIVPAIVLPMNWIDNQQDYHAWNAAILKVICMNRNCTVDIPVKSTPDMLSKDGLNPIAIVDYMSSNAEPDFYDSKTPGLAKYYLNDKSEGLAPAMRLFISPLSQNLLDAFMIKEEDLENGLESFFELADPDDLIDRRAKMLHGEILPGQPEYDPTYNNGVSVGDDGKDALDTYNLLKFAYDSLTGNVSIGALAEGMDSDAKVRSIVNTATILLSVAYAEFGTNYSSIQNFIRRVDESNLLDPNILASIRDEGYKGYLVDRAQLRESRSDYDKNWCYAYCSKVFREISNKPIAEQRPYLMEIITLECKNKADMQWIKALECAVNEAIDKSDLDDKPFSDHGILQYYNNKKCAKDSARYLAATLFFYIVTGRIKDEPINGVHRIPIPVAGYEKLQVEIKDEYVTVFRTHFNAEAHKKYVTLYDYCSREYSPNKKSGWFAWTMVNADITPWSVNPKPGYAIRSYPLMPNFYGMEDLAKVEGTEFVEAAIAKNALLGYKANGNFVSTPLGFMDYTKFVPTYEPEEEMLAKQFIREAKTPEDLDCYLSDREYESVRAYVKRWNLEKARARAKGLTLMSIPLKQDLVYKEIAQILYGVSPIQEPEYAQYGDDRKCIKEVDMIPIRWSESRASIAIGTNKYRISQFSTKDVTLDDNVDDILSGDYEPSVPILVSGNNLVICGEEDIKIMVSGLTQDAIQDLCNDNIIKQVKDGLYFVRAINGDYTIQK